MPWLVLLLAGVFEIGWAIGLKYTEGFSRLWPTVGTVAAMALSLALLGIAMKSLPVGTAYAVWVGIGATLTVVWAIATKREAASTARVVLLCVLVGSCLFVFAARDGGKVVFWIGGMVLSAAVGPAQAASRSLLARVTPDGMQGEIFGLYATTGRVVSFLSPLLWTTFIMIGGATHWGIIGITVVLALGLILLLLVKLPGYVRPHPAAR